jgi:modulator of FtsH protease HflC
MQNRFSAVAIMALVALLVVSGSVFEVDQRERALLFQLGEIKKAEFTPGLHFKLPFVQSVQKLDARLQTLDNQTENFLTSEKKNVEVDYYIKWRIADPRQFYRATGGKDILATERLSSIINRGLRDEFGARSIQQVVSSDREGMMQALEKSAADKVKELGIEIADVRIKSINLPREVSDSVYDRMTAERKRVASDLRAKGAEQYEKISADADRDAQVIIADAYRDAEKTRGEGDAKAAAIYAGAYGQDAEFYHFYRSLQAYRESFKAGQDVMVLDPDSAFFRTFKNGAGK